MRAALAIPLVTEGQASVLAAREREAAGRPVHSLSLELIETATYFRGLWTSPSAWDIGGEAR